MPIINILLAEGKPSEYIKSVADGVHEALMETWDIPLLDRFHLIKEYKKEFFNIDKKMWDVERSDDVIVFQIISTPRTKEMKLAFYKRLPEILYEKVKLRPEDVFINIVTSNYEDWSFGNGQTQLLD